MTEKNEKAKVLQQKYMEFQLLERQMKQVQAQIEQLESQLGELVYLEQSLEEIKHVKDGKEIFVPMGAGIFLQAALKNHQDVLVNVGSGIVVKKTVDQARELLEKQVRELRAVEEERAEKFAEMSQTAGSVEQELAKLIEEEEHV